MSILNDVISIQFNYFFSRALNWMALKSGVAFPWLKEKPFRNKGLWHEDDVRRELGAGLGLGGPGLQAWSSSLLNWTSMPPSLWY